MSAEESRAWHWRVEPSDESEMLGWLLLRWRVDPICFAVEALRVKLMPYQAQILLDLFNAPAELYAFYGLDPTFPKCQVLAPSGHGLGKTRTMAIAIWCHKLTRPFSKRLITAPTSEQITGQLFGEARKLFRRLKRYWPAIANDWDVLTDSIRHKNPDYGDWATIARTARADKPESLQGAHALDVDDEDGQLAALFGEEADTAPSGGMMVLIDEGSGVDDVVRETLEGALSEEGACLLAAANPTRPDGWFARDIERHDRYAVHQLDCRMSDRTREYSLPYRDFGGNVHQLAMRGFIDPSYWLDILAECDGDEDHDRVRVRVRGVIPRSASDQVIRSAWVDEAMRRQPDPASVAEPVIIGLDFGLSSDKHALSVRQGFAIRDVQEWLKRDRPDEVLLDAAHRAIEAQGLYGAKFIIGDANGVGRGAMEYLSAYFRERPDLNVSVVFFNAGESALDKKRYNRRRDEMWFKHGRAFFANPRCSLPVIPGLKVQLCTPQYEDRQNRIFVESKTDIAHRTGQPSGNAADAVLQTLLVHVPSVDAKPIPEPAHPPVFEAHFKRWVARREAQSGAYIR